MVPHVCFTNDLHPRTVNPDGSLKVRWTLKGVSEGPMVRYALQRYEPLKVELQAFLCAVQEGTPVPVSGEDGLAALRLALVESGRTHQVIEVQNGAG